MNRDSKPPHPASGTTIQGQCAYCGQRLDLLRAPEMRMRGSEQSFFCSSAHAQIDSSSTHPEQSIMGPLKHSSFDNTLTDEIAEGDNSKLRVSTVIDSNKDTPVEAGPTKAAEEEIAETSSKAVGAEPKIISNHQRAKLAPKETAQALIPIGATFILACLLAFSLALLWSGQLGFAKIFCVCCVSVLFCAELILERNARKTLENQAAHLFGNQIHGHCTNHNRLKTHDWINRDGIVVEGQATAAWLGQDHPSMVRNFAAHDKLIAGFQLTAGYLELQSGESPAAKPVASIQNLVTSFAHELEGVRVARRFRWIAALLAPVVSFVLDWSGGVTNSLELVWRMTLVSALLSGVYRDKLFSYIVYKTLLHAYRQGIIFANAASLEKAGRVKNAIFSVRGSLLNDKPELVEVIPLSDHDTNQLIALAHAALGQIDHPIAHGLQFAVTHRHLDVVPVEHSHVERGSGVEAQWQGQQLVVGSREIFQQHRISVAKAEQEIGSLEQSGRTVVLVALNKRLVGLLGFKDQIKSGTRHAITQLQSAQIETILLSGDSQTTTGALAAQLDIQRFRAGIPRLERGNAVNELSEEGHFSALIGRSPLDDAAMNRADIAVVMNAAVARHRSDAVLLTIDSPASAANALLLSQKLREKLSRRDLGLRFAEILALLMIFTAFLPIYTAPIFLGAIVLFGSLEDRLTRPEAAKSGFGS